MDTITELRLLQIKNLIANKEMVIATANRELTLGGCWLSDHQGMVDMFERDIDAITQEIYKYS